MQMPNITIYDAIDHEIVTREMTQQEYADLIASGWTPGEEATEE